MTMWDIAAGVILGMFPLALFGAGFRAMVTANDASVAAVGLLIIACGIGIAIWILFFKTHYL